MPSLPGLPPPTPPEEIVVIGVPLPVPTPTPGKLLFQLLLQLFVLALDDQEDFPHKLMYYLLIPLPVAQLF